MTRPPRTDELDRRGRATVGTQAAAATAWQVVWERVAAIPPAERTGVDHDALADALFWLDRPDESVAARHDAYVAHAAAGDATRAMRSAWRLFYDHFLVGELAIAGGWLERARRHTQDSGTPAARGFLAVAEAEWALVRDSDPAAGLDHARHAVALGRTAPDADLTAMALMTEGRLLIELGHVADGTARLDDAMVAVVNGELDALFTGWIYCAVLALCRDLADLRRAAEWTDAAMRWCEQLQDGRFYPGTCRVHRVEIACLQGAWATAEIEARRACEELTAHDVRYAGEAFYLTGELCRLTGDTRGAERAFRRAQELGRPPQPGLAHLRLAQGRPDRALTGLRLALQAPPDSRLLHAQLFAAQVEVELHAGDVAAADQAAADLAALAGTAPSPYLDAMAALAAGQVLRAAGDPAPALVELRRACATFRDLGLPYDTARARVHLALAARDAGDHDTAAVELEAALAAFQGLGAIPDAIAVGALIGRPPQGAAALSDREVEVLRLVARGKTNQEIGEDLFISRHTVARHLSNIFAKLDVSSRAAATARAYELGHVDGPGDGPS